MSSDDGSNLFRSRTPIMRVAVRNGRRTVQDSFNSLSYSSWEISRTWPNEAQKTHNKYYRRDATLLVPRVKVDLFQIRRSWENGSVSLSRLRRGCRCTIQRYRWDQSAGVFRWEDSIFCKPRRQFDAEASRSCRRSPVRKKKWMGCLA